MWFEFNPKKTIQKTLVTFIVINFIYTRIILNKLVKDIPLIQLAVINKQLSLKNMIIEKF